MFLLKRMDYLIIDDYKLIFIKIKKD